MRVVGWTDDKGNAASNVQSTALPQVGKPGGGGNMMTADLLILNNGLNTTDVGLTHKLSYDWSIINPSAAFADICLSVTEAADFITQTKMDCFRTDVSVSAAVSGFKHGIQVQAKSVNTTTVYQ